MGELDKKIVISAFEKKIYNQWLITTRVNQGKPFKLRENFDKIEPEVALALNRISRRLTSNPSKQINLKVYFEAPYHFQEKGKSYFNLEYYCSLGAISQYRRYYDQFLLQNPDDENALITFKESITFIVNFCKKTSIDINNYIDYNLGATPAWLNHLTERKISIYPLFAFKTFTKSFNKFYNIRKEMLSREYDSIDKLRAKYLSSPKTKKNIILFRDYVEKKGN